MTRPTERNRAQTGRAATSSSATAAIAALDRPTLVPMTLELTCARSIVATTVASVLCSTATACGGSATRGAGAGADATLTLARSSPPSSFAVGEMASSGPADNYYQAVYDTADRTWTPTEAVGGPGDRLELRRTGLRLSLTLRERRHVHRRHRLRRRCRQGEPGEGEGRPAARPAPRSVRSTTSRSSTPTHADVVLSAARPRPGRRARAQLGLHGQPDGAWPVPDLATTPVGSGPYALDADPSTAGSDLRLHPQRRLLEHRLLPVRRGGDQVPRRHHRAILNGLRSGQTLRRRWRSAQRRRLRCQAAGLNVVTVLHRDDRGLCPLGPGRRTRPGARRRPRPAGHQLRLRPGDHREDGQGRPGARRPSRSSGRARAGYDESLEGTYTYDLDQGASS